MFFFFFFFFLPLFQNNTTTARTAKAFMKFAPSIAPSLPPELLPRIHDDELLQDPPSALSSLSFAPSQPPPASSHPLSNSTGGGRGKGEGGVERYALYSTNSMKFTSGGGGPYMNLVVKGNVKMPSLVKQK